MSVKQYIGRGNNPNSQKNLQKANGQPRNSFVVVRKKFISVFNKLGGEKELLAWATFGKNREKFYEFIVKMLPKELKIEGDVNLGTRVIYLPQRQFRDGQVVTNEAKQAMGAPNNGGKQGNPTPLLEHDKEDIKKAI